MGKKDNRKTGLEWTLALDRSRRDSKLMRFKSPTISGGRAGSTREGTSSYLMFWCLYLNSKQKCFLKLQEPSVHLHCRDITQYFPLHSDFYSIKSHISSNDRKCDQQEQIRVVPHCLTQSWVQIIVCEEIPTCFVLGTGFGSHLQHPDHIQISPHQTSFHCWHPMQCRHFMFNKILVSIKDNFFMC